MIVPHETVRILLKQIDPAAVLNRRQHRLHRRSYFSRGPCHMWHIDGYDKLRPYGILISGYGTFFLLWYTFSHSYIWPYALGIKRTTVYEHYKTRQIMITSENDSTIVPGTAADKPPSRHQSLSYRLESLKFWRCRRQ